MHAFFCCFYLFFHTRSFFTSMTPNKDQKIEQQFYFLSFKFHNPETSMSSVMNIFVHAVHKRSQKVPRAKRGTFN